jgi:hypothetical protein
MNKIHQVLILSDAIDSILPPLEQIMASQNAVKFKFIHPTKLYASDFKESEFIILDYQFWIQNREKLEKAMQYPEKISMFTILTDPGQMNSILKETHVPHFFGMSGTHTLRDIANYLIASVSQKFWTAETFIEKSITQRSSTVFRTTERLQDQIHQSLEAHALSETFEGFRPILEKILDELLTNALFNAPIDSKGTPLYRDHERKEIVHAEAGKEPILEILEDEQKIILSVKDFYGSLTKKVIDHYLTHGEVAEKDGGAGVGMYLVMKDVHKLIINIDPGKSTEFIVVLHKFKRFYHYQSLEKSFHLFERKPS